LFLFEFSRRVRRQILCENPASGSSLFSSLFSLLTRFLRFNRNSGYAKGFRKNADFPAKHALFAHFHESGPREFAHFQRQNRTFSSPERNCSSLFSYSISRGLSRRIEYSVAERREGPISRGLTRLIECSRGASPERSAGGRSCNPDPEPSEGEGAAEGGLNENAGRICEVFSSGAPFHLSSFFFPQRIRVHPSRPCNPRAVFPSRRISTWNMDPGTWNYPPLSTSQLPDYPTTRLSPSHRLVQSKPCSERRQGC